jgi:serine/threonine-protein kinase
LQPPGTLLEGKYEILGKIREGGMGSIYRVRHRLLDEIRVVKVLRPQVVEDPEMRRRFLEEAKTAVRLKHPSICDHYDFALDDDGAAYLVMEYIDGVNLSDLLKSSGRPGLPLALEIAHQALLALSYLHRRGVIHRDVAPDNLMLSRDEEGRPLVKLIDLGIAKALDRPGEMTATGVFLGKLKYASPEQYGKLAAGETLDGRSDLYSLAIVLYELLTGMRPFSGETPAELLQAHLFDPPLDFAESDPEGRVPPELRAAVLKALEKKREDRYASAEEFDREILVLRHRFVGEEDLEATMAILSSIPIGNPSYDNVTPSAQDRLNRQFGSHPTPRPSSEGLTIAPTVAAERAKGPVSPGGASQGSAPKPAPLPASAPPGPAPELRDTRPLPPPRRRNPVPGIALAVLFLGALLVWRPWVARTTAPGPIPLKSEPSPILTELAAPTAPATLALESTAVPSVEPAREDAAGSASFTRTAEPEPEPDLSTLRREAESARSAAARARQSALRARAPERAAALYDVASRKEREAQQLLADGQFRPSRATFEQAARDFAGATSWIASHPEQRPAAPEKIGSLPESTPAPQSTVRIEATAAPAVIAPSPEVVRPTAPAEVAGGVASDTERIRGVLTDYERAQDTLDVDLYARVYPSLAGAQRQSLERAWQGLAKQQVDLEIRQIEVKNSRAVVRAFQRLVATPRIGSELRDARERVFRLERRGDSWVIVGLD